MPVQAEVSSCNLSVLAFPDTLNPQVRTLLNDYITDEEQGVVSGRNPISSINEVLREGRYTRDKSKVSHTIYFDLVVLILTCLKLQRVFRFADTDLKTTGKTLNHLDYGATNSREENVLSRM